MLSIKNNDSNTEEIKLSNLEEFVGNSGLGHQELPLTTAIL